MAARSTGLKRAFRDIERRRRLILAVRENPDWTHQELADHLSCDRSTITRDLGEITRDLQKMNTESFQVHWQRMQMEIQANKMLCIEMLRESRAAKKGSGSRWLEEMTKIMQMEMKLLGLDKFDPMLGSDRVTFDKKERDAAVDAALKGYEIGKQLGNSASSKMVGETDRASSNFAPAESQGSTINGPPIDLVPPEEDEVKPTTNETGHA